MANTSVNHSVHKDNYNLEIEDCNLFAMLFYSKVGKYSSEEFQKAKSLFDKSGILIILIFQKNINLPKNLSKADPDSRYEFLERLNKLEHFPVLFENTDNLINELEDAIDKLLQDEDFVKHLKVD
jgi:hypothetical protein